MKKIWTLKLLRILMLFLLLLQVMVAAKEGCTSSSGDSTDSSGKSKVDEDSGCASNTFNELAAVQMLATLTNSDFYKKKFFQHSVTTCRSFIFYRVLLASCGGKRGRLHG